MDDQPEVLLRLASEARREHRLDDAARLLTEAVEQARRSCTPTGLAKSLTALGRIERDRQNLDAATKHYSEAEAVFRDAGDAAGLAHALRHLSDLHREQGCIEPAQTACMEAIRLYRDDPNTPPLDLANSLRVMALVKEMAGDHVQSRSIWEEARTNYAAAQVHEGVVECDSHLAKR